MLLKILVFLGIIGVASAMGNNVVHQNQPQPSASPAIVTASCSFTTVKNVMTLNNDCQTDQTVVVPNGMTLDGANHKITAIDPTGNHFKGAIVKNAGASVNVKNLNLDTNSLSDICDGGNDRLRGILVEEAQGTIANNTVSNINQGASGCQEGNGIEVRNFGTSSNTSVVTISNNVVRNYQKTGIIVNGNSEGKVTDNIVDGIAPTSVIARNGIQIGFGAKAQVKGNTVSNNSYTGTSTVSGGIIIVAGPFYDSDYGINSLIDGNTLSNNDIGVFLTNLDENGNAPTVQTNIKVVGNTISNQALSNHYSGGYQAGISDVGNNDKMINNNISGIGYTPDANPGAYTVAIDADQSFTNKPKVQANKVE